MPTRLTRPAAAVALALAVGLLALPACKKKVPTTPGTPDPGTAAPGPTTPPVAAPQAGNSGRDPVAPRSPVFAAGYEAPMRADAMKSMGQIMMALHNYHDQNGKFPGGFADKTGKPGLSWRVAILPFLEQQNLFTQFKLDEPWDSESNKKLIQYMPKQFAPPRTDTNGYTFCRGFSGPNTWLPARSGKPGQPLDGVPILQIVDGTSNTILVAEAYEPVIWTKPDELAFNPAAPPKLGGVFGTGAVVGMGDGSTRFINKTIDPKALANAIQINDGNVVDFGN